MINEVHIEVVGNAYKLQLQVFKDAEGIVDHGKPVVILDTAEDEVIGKAVRDLLRTRIRVPRKAKGGEAVPA
jgi:hypothetical protein